LDVNEQLSTKLRGNQGRKYNYDWGVIYKVSHRNGRTNGISIAFVAILTGNRQRSTIPSRTYHTKAPLPLRAEMNIATDKARQ